MTGSVQMGLQYKSGVAVMKKVLPCQRILPIATQFTRCIQSSQPTPQVAKSPSVDQEPVLKSWRELPSPPRWPLLKHMHIFMKKEAGNGQMHVLYEQFHEKYGKVFRCDLPEQPSMIFVADPKMAEALFRQEEKYPSRPYPKPWGDVRDENRLNRGLVTSDGETWSHYRRAISKAMMRPKNVQEYCEPLNEVTTDLVKHIKRKKAAGDGLFVPSLPYEFNRWGIEVSSVVMFEKRFGALDETVNPEAQTIIDCFRTVTSTTPRLYNLYGLQKRFKSKTYRAHEEAWRTIFELGRKIIHDRVVELEEESKSFSGDEVAKGGILSFLLAKKELSTEDVVSNTIDLMFAGVDTTASTLSFAVYLLTKNRQAQEKLYEEIRAVIGDREATTDDLQHMPYLRAVFKETNRIYPITLLLARMIRSPITLGQYHVDPGVVILINNYAMGRDAEIYKDPESFSPERWIRGSGEDVNPFASLAFGTGVRMCIGRRFAELEIYLALIKLLQHFDLKPRGDMSQFYPLYQLVLTAGKEVPVEFHDRF